MSDDLSTSGISPTQHDPARAELSAAQNALRRTSLSQIASKNGLEAWIDQGAFNTGNITRNFQSLELKRKRAEAEQELEQSGEVKGEIAEVQKGEETAEKYHRRNPELQPRSLILLKSRIQAGDTKEEILRKVLESYPDYYLADEALEYLLETTDKDLKKEVQQARQEFNGVYEKDIKAGRNISQHARDFSQQGLGSPTGLRSLYREVTVNPRDSNTLFNELTGQFDYEKMKTVIDFLLHSLGSDLKSKGPSIDPGELHRLVSETRKLQSILSIFRFFKSRMNLIIGAFSRNGLILPSRVTFEFLAKQFMRLVQERYPSSDKVLQFITQLTISEELLAYVIILTQMRDAMRQTAPKLFRSDQQRLDLLNSFLDAIEDLDERIEEQEEEEEKKEKEKEEEQ